MKFEEQFPSLKDTGINLGLSDVEEVTKELIIKHCLDKQRARDILNQYDDHDEIILDDLKRELGLED